MHHRTKATIDELASREWFVAVGQRVDAMVITLATWSDAIASCCSDEWQNLLLEAANQYRERLMETNPAEFGRWNERVQMLKPVILPLVAQKTDEVIRDQGLPTAFRETVEWDILHVCMEAEYASVYPPGFYASQAFWYVKGHFPCGWQGDFPQGRLVIF